MKNDLNSNKDLISKFKDLNIDPILLDSRGFNYYRSNATSLATLSNLNSNLAAYMPNPMNSNSFIIKNNTSEVLNQLGNAVEIKNNNFEINNNFYGSINIDANSQNKNAGGGIFIYLIFFLNLRNNKNITISVNYLDNNMPVTNKSVNSINYSLDEQGQEKINWLCYLATPKILFMLLDNHQTMAFIFKLIPSRLCHSHMIEHYVLQWSDIQTLNPVIDIIIPR